MNRLNIKKNSRLLFDGDGVFFVYPYGSDAREGLCRLCKSIYRQYQPSAGAYLPNRTSAELDAQGLSGKRRLYIGQGKRPSGGGDQS